MGYFRWVNHAQASAPEGRQPLIINLDETSLAYSFTGSVGTVVCEKYMPDGVQQGTENANTADTRGHVTYVSMITHDSAVQPKVPQVILGNEHRFTKTLLASVKPQVPSNVVLMRCKSAWNCHATMRAILSLLARTLGKLAKDRYVILLLDVHRSHIHGTIFTHARRLGIRLVYIPPKLTSMLQPCDTHLFSHLKCALREAWRDARSNAGADISPGEWLSLIFSCIRQVLQGRSWLKAFRSTGALASQKHLSPRVFYRMGLQAAPVAPLGPPSLHETLMLFPQRLRVNRMAYVLWCPASKVPKEGLSSSSSSGPLPSTSGAAACHAVPSAAEHSSSSSLTPPAPAVPDLRGRALKWVLRPRGAKNLD